MKEYWKNKLLYNNLKKDSRSENVSETWKLIFKLYLSHLEIDHKFGHPANLSLFLYQGVLRSPGELWGHKILHVVYQWRDKNQQISKS